MTKSNESKENQDPQIFELSRALQEFGASARYGFLKSLQVGKFLKLNPGDPNLGAVEEITFEKLIELGSKKLAKLRWLTPAQTQVLIGLLNSLAENTPDVPTQEQNEEKEENNDSPEMPSDVQLWSSVEAENKIRAVIKELKNSGKFEQVSGNTLGSYWREHWPRSPFEEAMTIRQISEIEVATLLKKRSVSATKIGCIIAALSSVLEDQVPPSQIEPEEPPAKANVISFVSPTVEERFHAKLSGAPPSIAAMAALFSAEQKLLSSPKTTFARLCFDLSTELSPHQLSLIVHEMELKSLAAADNDLDTMRVNGVVNGLVNQVKERIFNRYPSVISLWKELLKGPGTNINLLVELSENSGLSEAVVAGWCLVLLRLMEAEPLVFFDKKVAGLWTIDHDWNQAAEEAIRQILPAKAKDLNDNLACIVFGPHSESIRQCIFNSLVRHNGKWILR